MMVLASGVAYGIARTIQDSLGTGLLLVAGHMQSQDTCFIEATLFCTHLPSCHPLWL
jgi:hypothetical protein